MDKFGQQTGAAAEVRGHRVGVSEVTAPMGTARQWLKLPTGCSAKISANVPQSNGGFFETPGAGRLV